MISKLHKKILAFSLAGCMLATAVQWPMATKAQTETDSTTEEFVLTDDFSDAEHTKSMWSADLSEKIQDGVVQIEGDTDKYLISDAKWDNGNKPLKFSFEAYTVTQSNENNYWPDGGLAVQVLNSENMNLVFGINTWQSQGYYAYRVNGSNFSCDGKTTDLIRIYQGQHKKTELQKFTFTYDWSKWDEVEEGQKPQVTITVQAYGSSVSKTFVCESETKPETFNVGIKSENTQKGLVTTAVDNVFVEYRVSEENLIKLVNAKYQEFDSSKNYENAKSYLEMRKLLGENSKDAVADSYKKVCDWLKEQAYTDDFSDKNKTAVMWTNGLSDKITNETVSLSGKTDKYLISDEMWDEGNKPTKLSFTAHSVETNISSADDGLVVQLLSAGNTEVCFHLNTAQQYQFHKVQNSEDFTLEKKGNVNSNSRVWQTGFSGAKDVTDPVTYTFTYDWSKWETEAVVRISVIRQLNNDKVSAVLNLTYNEATKPETFKLGFANNKLTHIVDDVSIEYQVSEVKMQEQVLAKYQKFMKNKTYALANEFLTLYETLATSSKEVLTAEYKNVCGWLKAAAYEDDFANLDKTEMMWTNNLQNQVSEGSVILSGASDLYMISDHVWDNGNVPTKFTISSHALEWTSNWTDAKGGLHLRLLDAEGVSLTFICNTAQDSCYFGFSAKGGTVTGQTSNDGIQTAEDIRVFGQLSNLNDKTASHKIVVSYDWSKWERTSQVGIRVDITDKNGTSMMERTYNAVFTYTGEAEAKPTTFKVGFQSKLDKYAIDSINLDLQVNNSVNLSDILQEKYQAFASDKCYATADAYMKIYLRLSDSGRKTLDTEREKEYQTVYKWLIEQEKAFEDDFSDSDKTKLMWTNELQNMINDNQEAELKGLRQCYLISDAVWKENSRPTEFSFTAKTKNDESVDQGLYFVLLSSDVADIRIEAATKQTYGYHKCEWAGFTTDLDDTRVWHWSTQLETKDDGFNTYTFKYDWSQWDNQGIVKITCIATGANGQETTQIISATYNGEDALKPNTFKVGFENRSYTTVVDNVKISYENPSTVLTAKGATISTNLNEGTMLRFGFDYSSMREHMTRKEEELVNYGAILVARKDTDAETMKEQLKTLHGSAADGKFTQTTYSSDNMFMVTVGNASATQVPNNYNVDIKGSDNIEEGYIDKEICAVGYVITKSEDGTYHYYFTNTVDNEKSIEGGRVKKSVMDLLTAANKELVSRYDDASDADKATFTEAVTGFKTNDSDTHTYTMEEYKAVVNGTESTLDKNNQKQWLRYVFLQTQVKQ